MTIRKVGEIKFGEYRIPVYKNVDEPLFNTEDVAFMVNETVTNLIDMSEFDERYYGKILDGGERRLVCFLTETGLYDILAQGKTKESRAWRRIISNKLIEIRKNLGRDVVEQFEDYDHELDTIYFDDQGRMWQSITVAGGDVEQVCLSEEKS